MPFSDSVFPCALSILDTEVRGRVDKHNLLLCKRVAPAPVLQPSPLTSRDNSGASSPSPRQNGPFRKGALPELRDSVNHSAAHVAAGEVVPRLSHEGVGSRL